MAPGFGQPGVPISLPGGGSLTIPAEGLTQAEYNVLSGVRAGNPVGGPFAQQLLDSLIQRGIVTAGTGPQYGTATGPAPQSTSAPVPQPPPPPSTPAPQSTSAPHPQPPPTPAPVILPAPTEPPVVTPPPGGAGIDPSIRLAMPGWMRGMPGATTDAASRWARENPNLPGAAEILAALEQLAGRQRNPLSLLRG